MITLRNFNSGETLGTITEEQLQFLIDQLEEEFKGDKDYYLTRDTLDLLQQQGLDKEVAALLTQAMGTRDDIEIEWSRD